MAGEVIDTLGYMRPEQVGGTKLADTTEAVDPNSRKWPTELAGVQVYFNGVRAPIFFASPDQVSAQIPYEFLDTTSINAYLRIRHANGSVSVTTPVARSAMKTSSVSRCCPSGVE